MRVWAVLFWQGISELFALFSLLAFPRLPALKATALLPLQAIAFQNGATSSNARVTELCVGVPLCYEHPNPRFLRTPRLRRHLGAEAFTGFYACLPTTEMLAALVTTLAALLLDVRYERYPCVIHEGTIGTEARDLYGHFPSASAL